MTPRIDIFEVMIRNIKSATPPVLLVILFGLLGIQQEGYSQKIDGLTVVAPPKPYSIDPFDAVDAVESDWIGLVPYGFTRIGKTEVHFDTERQWWGERSQGVKKSIEMAQSHGLSIMLKPQVYVPGSWPGDLTFTTEDEWHKWETSYRQFILHWAKIANTYEVEILCIGTEFKLSTKDRNQFWLDLIEEIRKIYCGELTYSANWDEYTAIQFWSELDYIGVSSYFPLLEEDTPEINDLIEAWKPRVKELAKVTKKYNKQLLFTEYGYLSVNGCCGKTWLLEKSVRSLPINEQCQANGIEAILTTFGQQEWWAGGFLWKWFPNGKGHEGYIPRDYTPQDKLSEQVLKKHFSQW